ncbi:hypothetical protein [Sphingosinicella sp. BN140058]|uniref:hypothetical protein n=1 Tax=Sphingosinicella sp. BN140058 TaxID=1892855 RepID=UPI0010108CE1|nr:hypothetical protein [Sphingosinicella sp. BN140058]QAY78688.1 hypothetical protein ETR14_20700 [Sphingosinicella sp. BN140058]
MPTKDEFRAELEAQLCRAALRGDAYLDVNAGDLHRPLGGYPGARQSDAALLRGDVRRATRGRRDPLGAD